MEIAKQVINVALGMDIWVFGGYVRDVMIRGRQTFGDLDLCCSNVYTSPSQFIRVLGTLFKVTNCRKKTMMYGRMSRGIQRVIHFLVNDTLHVDLVVFDGTFENWCDEKSTDFTCNLFYKSYVTQLGMRYIPEKYKYVSDPISLLVEMTKRGVFERIWDADSESNHMHVLQLCERAETLVRRGLTFQGDLLTAMMEYTVIDKVHIHTVCEKINSDISNIQARRTMREMLKSLMVNGISVPEDIGRKIEDSVR